MNNQYIKWDPIAKRYVYVPRDDMVKKNLIGTREVGVYRDDKRTEFDEAFSKQFSVDAPKSPKPPKTKKRKGVKRLGGQARINQVHRLATRDGWTCHWCGVGLSLNIRIPPDDTPTLRHPTIDHLIRVRDGGGNQDDNCVLSCLACNNKREDGWDE